MWLLLQGWMPPERSAIEQMLADYQVMRDQARACERLGE